MARPAKIKLVFIVKISAMLKNRKKTKQNIIKFGMT